MLAGITRFTTNSLKMKHEAQRRKNEVKEISYYLWLFKQGSKKKNTKVYYSCEAINTNNPTGNGHYHILCSETILIIRSLSH